jgi:hypothetical protein
MIPDHTRELSVKKVDFPLTKERIRKYLIGRDSHRRSRYIVLKRGEQSCVVELIKRGKGKVFDRITGLKQLASPEETVWIEAPDIDVWNRSEMYRITSGVKARCVVVKGLYEYVNFTFDSKPTKLRVVDTVPPEPPRLIVEATKALALTDYDVFLEPHIIDLRRQASAKSGELMVPCNLGDWRLEPRPYFLSETPSIDKHLSLLGCEMSKDIFEHLYGYEPEFMSMCPKKMELSDNIPTLARCCQKEDRLQKDGNIVYVPWGFRTKHLLRAFEYLLDGEPRK